MELKFQQLKVDTKPGRNSTMNVVELKNYIDFDVKRVYYTTAIQGDTSQHCHLKEQELFLMISGNCTAVIDRGNGLENVPLQTGDAVYIGNYVWHGFKDFSPDAVLFAISSTNYNPNREDYIEDYEKYKIEAEKYKNA
jgi:mannose-6-phosphate isomerase-like protein (cupin superfamily)